VTKESLIAAIWSVLAFVFAVTVWGGVTLYLLFHMQRLWDAL
jgi:hypothetical protein